MTTLAMLTSFLMPSSEPIVRANSITATAICHDQRNGGVKVWGLIRPGYFLEQSPVLLSALVAVENA